MKAARKNQLVLYKGFSIRSGADFSSNTMETKGRDDIQSADRNILSTKNFVADKTSFQENEREIKIFPDKN